MASAQDVVETITLKPDAGLVKSLGAHYSLESAIADLVDNCLDAGATKVAIRLLTESDRLVQVEVIDNGGGMDAAAADKAMTLGHRREYADQDLGHFGIGMKAASFGHADVLTVWASKYGAEPVGRRIRRTDFSRDFSC
jgi:signal transduction histidine kinase